MSVVEILPAAPAAPRGQSVHYKWIALSNTTLGILMVTINQSILLISLPGPSGINLNPLVPSNTSYFLWVFMGFVLVTAVLVVSLGRVGASTAGSRCMNLGFRGLHVLLDDAVDERFLYRPGGRARIIIMRNLPGGRWRILSAELDRPRHLVPTLFPEERSGARRWGDHGIAAVSGCSSGAPGGVSPPSSGAWCPGVRSIGLFARSGLPHAPRQRDPHPAEIDWAGQRPVAIGLVCPATGIVYSLLPYGGHPTGWTSPFVLTAVIGGIAILALFAWVETKVPQPMFRPGLFRIRAFTGGNIAGLLGALGRGGLQFMLIIWPQGIWLPQHGYSFSQTPSWAGIAMVPLTVGFLIVGPLAGALSDRYGARLFATAGLIVSGAAFLLLELLPINFSYVWFAALIFLFAVGMGLFFSPNQASVMNSLPPDQRGAGAGMLNTFQNSATVLSMGLFFTIVTLGLASHLPKHLYSGLVAAGVPAAAAHTVANEPPIGSLFSAFLGYNPIQQLLGPTGALRHLPPRQVAYITGRSFFPKLIEQPFASGLHLAFTFAAIATAIAIVASAVRGQRYLHTTEPLAEELADGAAETGGLVGLKPLATDGQDAPDTIGRGAGNGNGRPVLNRHAATDGGRLAKGRRAGNGQAGYGQAGNGQGANGTSPPAVSGADEESGSPLGGA